MRPRYRGSGIGGWTLQRNTPFNGECDIHTSEADEFLELSRNDFTRGGYDQAHERLSRVFRAIMPSWLGRLRQTTEESDRHILPYASFYAMLHGIEAHGEEWGGVLFTSGLRYGREPKPTLDLGAIAAANEVLVGDVSAYEYTATFEDQVVVVRGPATDSRQHWLAVFLRKFFPSRQLESIIKGPHRQYRLKKGQPEEDVTDNVLAHLFAPTQQGFAGRRHVLPCPRRFAGLAYAAGSEDQWLPGWDHFILATMANPFLCSKHRIKESGMAVDLVIVPQVRHYVRWLAKQRGEPEAHIAEQLLDFIRHVDKLMEDEWHGFKQYDLKIVETDLRRIE